MKYFLLYKFSTLILLLSFLGFSAQNKFRLPENTVFYMEMNGKQLNSKVNWAKFNPIFKKILEKDKKVAIWNDYSKTGIKYDDTQFHYFTYNDSVKSYTTHFILDDEARFRNFINTTKKEGLEITKKSNYSYVSLDEKTFVAWNDKHAVLKFITYSKPFNYDNYALADSTVVVADSVATNLPEDEIVDKSFDYKEEIKYLEQEIVDNEKYIKETQEDNIRIRKDIAYLKKFHKYPKIKEIPAMEDEGDEPSEMQPPENEDDYNAEEEEKNYQKRMDSISIAEFKIVKNLSERSFDEIFSSNFVIDIPAAKTKFKDDKSDLFAYTNFSTIYRNNPVIAGLPSYAMIQNYMSKVSNADSYYNLYFDKDKVKLISNYSNQDPKIQKTVADFYSGSFNKKLSKLISDKSIGYFALNINGNKSFDATYELINKLAENQEYQKEIELMVETMKILLDEKAISKIAPGNAIFILNDVTYKNVEYKDFEYDDEYNEKEIKKTKQVATPDFTIAFITENENYWKKIFNLLATNKTTAENFSRNGDLYLFKNKDSSEIDKMVFTVRDGIVYLSTSAENIGEKKQSAATQKNAKESGKHSIAGYLNTQKLMGLLDSEFADKTDRNLYNLLRKKAGEITYKTDVKSESIQTEINYNIDNSSENSLMYFFDLFDDISDVMKPEEISNTL